MKVEPTDFHHLVPLAPIDEDVYTGEDVVETVEVVQEEHQIDVKA